MKKIITLMLMVVLAGCQVRDQQQGQKEQQPAPVEQAPMGLMQAETGIASTTSSAAQNGVSVAANLTSRYNDVRRDCGKLRLLIQAGTPARTRKKVAACLFRT